MTLSELKAKQEEYEIRLDVGAARIEEARAQGKDVDTWEDYWIQLLRQWEAVKAKVEELEKEQVAK
jgi:hypothetical protein